MPRLRALEVGEEFYSRLTLVALEQLLYHALSVDPSADRSANVHELIGVDGRRSLLVFYQLVNGELFRGREVEYLVPPTPEEEEESSEGCAIS